MEERLASIDTAILLGEFNGAQYFHGDAESVRLREITSASISLMRMVTRRFCLRLATGDGFLKPRWEYLQREHHLQLLAIGSPFIRSLRALARLEVASVSPMR